MICFENLLFRLRKQIDIHFNLLQTTSRSFCS